MKTRFLPMRVKTRIADWVKTQSYCYQPTPTERQLQQVENPGENPFSPYAGENPHSRLGENPVVLLPAYPSRETIDTSSEPG